MRYLIKRHGSNAANQSMLQTMVLGTVEAPDNEAARDLAKRRWTFYNNQRIEVIPLSRAAKTDRLQAEERDALGTGQVEPL